MSLCKDCVSGVQHEGTPLGTIESIGGVECYVGTPSIEYPHNKVLLYLSDVFGLALVNNKLLVDGFASNGFKTIMPDYFAGDPIPENAMSSPSFDREGWRSRHGKDITRPYLDKVILALKQTGVEIFAATGYCFGARYCVDLALDGAVQVIALTHPSMLQVPADFEALKAQSKVPILINSCEVDQAFPPEAQHATDVIMSNGQYAPGYTRTFWPGCQHGFAVRGDLSNEQVKAGKEGSFKATVEYLIRQM